MTREDAIRKLEYSKKAYQMLIDEKVDRGKLVGKDVKGEWKADTPLDEAYKSMIDALEIAVEALEQEPCEDAISRQAVLAQINYWIGSGEYRYTNATYYLCKKINSLKPVTPHSKTGHWIDGFGGSKCSECGCLEAGHSDYCPNCGAKMIEPQERSSKEVKKVFISQPMNGLSDLQIEKDRARVIECLHNLGYTPNKIAIIDTFIEEDAPDNVNSGLWYLGKSLELLADADIAVFAKGWKNARGCQIEYKCAVEYGIYCIYED